MNRRHQTNREETQTTHGKPWYQQPETTMEMTLEPLQVAQQPSVSASASASAQEPQTLFEPSAAERILARAGALQEAHGQMLSQEQIEAVAAELGIKPEFVRLAIEQEKTVSLLPRHDSISQARVGVTPLTSASTRKARIKITATSLGAIAVYGLSAAALFRRTPLFGEVSPSLASIVFFVFVLPALLSFSLGFLGRSRRFGAGVGVLLGITSMAAVIVGAGIQADLTQLSTWDLYAIAIMCGSGALLGVAGAQAQRVMSRRQASNRSKRTIAQEPHGA